MTFAQFIHPSFTQRSIDSVLKILIKAMILAKVLKKWSIETEIYLTDGTCMWFVEKKQHQI